MAGTFFDVALLVDVALMLRLAVDVSASIHRIGEYVVNRRVGGGYPADLALHALPQRKGQAFAAKPQPHLPRGAEFGETIEHRANGAGDSLVGMEPHLAILLAPEKADRQAAAQFAAGGLVADAAFQTRANDMKPGFTQGALQAEHQAIVEQRRMVEAVAVSDQGVGHAAQIQQTIPVCIVARQPRDFQAEHNPDPSQSDFTDHAREAGAVGGAGAGEAEVFIDHSDLVSGPT